MYNKVQNMYPRPPLSLMLTTTSKSNSERKGNNSRSQKLLLLYKLPITIMVPAFYIIFINSLCTGWKDLLF